MLPPIPNMVVIGDSISTSALDTGWPDQCAVLNIGSQYRWTNTAVAGERAAVMAANYQSVVGCRFNFTTTQTPWKASVLGGNDDIGSGDSAATIYGNLVSIWENVISQGGTPIRMTVMPSTGITGGHETIRLALNAMIIGYSTHPTLFFDAAAAFPDPTNATIYLDGTHLTTFGYSIFAADINPLLA